MSASSPGALSQPAELRDLKRRFDFEARKYPHLSCFLIFDPKSDGKDIGQPYPIGECRTPQDALSLSAGTRLFNFRRAEQRDSAARILPEIPAPTDPQTKFQCRAFYISDKQTPKTLSHYVHGLVLFEQLSDLAGRCLEDLPAWLLNRLVPPELIEYRDQVLARPLAKLREGSTPDHPEWEEDVDARFDAMLPPGDSAAARWFSWLHWLSWSPNAPRTHHVERLTWSYYKGSPSVFRWFDRREDYDREYSKPSYPGTRALLPAPSFEESRHYISSFKNVFLRSSLAIVTIIRMSRSGGPSVAVERPPRASQGGDLGKQNKSVAPNTEVESVVGDVGGNSADLKDKELNILISLNELKAFDKGTARSFERILVKAGYKKNTHSGDNHAIKKHLKSEGLIETARGPSGGTWLTEQGKAAIERRKSK
jgi:hypothetical protein